MGLDNIVHYDRETRIASIFQCLDRDVGVIKPDNTISG